MESKGAVQRRALPCLTGCLCWCQLGSKSLAAVALGSFPTAGAWGPEDSPWFSQAVSAP